MKKYFKRFWPLLTAVLVMGVIYAVVYFTVGNEKHDFTRTNQECLQTQRVFDFANKLTNQQEEELTNRIAAAERRTGCDIVLVIIDEYVGNYSTSLRDFADDFYDDNKFGYNKPWGDGVLYVDNWYDGNTWLCTTGRVESKFTSVMIDRLIKDICKNVNNETYKSYCLYVDEFEGMMNSSVLYAYRPTVWLIFIIAAIITGFYLVINLISNKGKKTTTDRTYVSGGRPILRQKEDEFLTKHITSRTIQSSSGGGGGGHHMSGGGHSHGGGGGHH